METYALIDSGSMITTISEDFYNSLRPLPDLNSLSKLDDFSVEGAGGHNLPYCGYIECTVEVPFLAGQSFEVPVLVVPTTQYGLRVPVVIGTNIIRQCSERSQSHTDIPKEWKNAFVSFQQTRVGVVKSTNHQDIKVQPFETVTLSGFVRKDRNVETVVTEQTQGASTRIGVCPRVVSLDKVSRSERVPVRIFNMSAKV
ncbi:MAG: retropepsin-like aspartic protease, partial [Candidatus Thiodiazotropha sp.]